MSNLTLFAATAVGSCKTYVKQ